MDNAVSYEYEGRRKMNVRVKRFQDFLFELISVSYSCEKLTAYLTKLV